MGGDMMNGVDWQAIWESRSPIESPSHNTEEDIRLTVEGKSQEWQAKMYKYLHAMGMNLSKADQITSKT